MAEASSAPHFSPPWSERLFDAARVSPLLLAAAISLSLLVLVFALEFAGGNLQEVLRGTAPETRDEEYRFSAVFALLIGYLPAAYTYAVRGSRRAIAELRPALQGTPAEVTALVERAGRFERSHLRWAGIVGAAITLTIPFFVDLSLKAYSIEAFQLTPAIHRALLPITGWLFGRYLFATLVDSRRLARVGRERVAVDLFDLVPLAPFTRYGLRNALLAMGMLAIVALLLPDWSARPGLVIGLAIGLLPAAALAAAGLVLPVRGVRTAIRDTKRAELAACNERIRERREAIAGGVAPGQGVGLDELVAWRGVVESVREWPFDASTFTRFLLYLAIPLGSWLGGAMVERVVDTALDGRERSPLEATLGGDALSGFPLLPEETTEVGKKRPQAPQRRQ